MENLLCSAFDLLSSYDPVHVQRGLRHLEGLLAKLCLGPATHSASPTTPSKKPDDPAYREFIKLQNGFEWNVAIRLINCLEKLLGKQSNAQTSSLILSCLDLLQGLLLLHAPSRQLFARETNMNILLDLLDSGNNEAVQCAALLTLVSALLGKPQNTRTFEALEGLPTITNLFKRRDTHRDVKCKCLEFLYFYLMPEGPVTPPPTPKSTTHHREGRRRGHSSSSSTSSNSSTHSRYIKSTREKQKMLGEWLTNVDDLVSDLQETTPFGPVLEI
ncbi:cell division control protein 14 [Peziza echinospora]|nr:cell division control protein 14 [Peziza echinospora]